jgi:hypothetical protein
VVVELAASYLFIYLRKTMASDSLNFIAIEKTEIYKDYKELLSKARKSI